MKCMEIKPMPYRVGEVDPLSKLPSLRRRGNSVSKKFENIFLRNDQTFFKVLCSI